MERPLALSDIEVETIGAGRTQVRRIIRPQPSPAALVPGTLQIRTERIRGELGIQDGPRWIRCPFGMPGDTLYVRETWGRTQESDVFAFRADPWLYRLSDRGLQRVRRRDHESVVWLEPVHMPRAIARWILAIEDVRAEALQEMSEEDARREAISYERTEQTAPAEPAFQRAVRERWDAGRRQPRHRFDANPFVWVITFRVDVDARSLADVST